MSQALTQEGGLVGLSRGRWSEAVTCSAVPAQGTRAVAFADGVTRLYSYRVYLSTEAVKPLEEYLKDGAEVELELASGRVATLPLLGYQVYQSHAVLWV